MMTRALLAATVASGVILPAKAEVYLPSRPAIIKPGNIEFSKNLLAMPMTMGMLKSGGRTRGTISYVGGGSSASTTATTITISCSSSWRSDTDHQELRGVHAVRSSRVDRHLHGKRW